MGASINLMLLSIYNRLDINELKPTIVTLQLVNRSIKYSSGVLENVSIRIGKFYIPIDFIVLEMKEDTCIPIILGRPFLAIAEAIINIKNEKLIFEIGQEKVEFNIFELPTQPSVINSCYKTDIMEKYVDEILKDDLPKDALESYLINNGLYVEIFVYTLYLEVTEKVRPINSSRIKDLN